MDERPRFEKLEVWQIAHALALEAYRVTNNFPASEKYRLTDQICRAASSVATNIAEGDGRQQSKDQIHFLHMARGSLSELRYLFTLCRDLSFISTEKELLLNIQASKLHAKLHAFIKSKQPSAV